ncbi:hypothetical protein [Enterobacter cloacae]|uniref:hypothetical protein n=1 Tax=Enterobacter cloacae TaxID=550 RepID=UPI0040433405
MATFTFNSELQPESESAYRHWLSDNPNGFVVNTLKNSQGLGSRTDARFTRIHRVSCKSINPHKRKKDTTGFTTGRYQKICTLSLDEACNEAMRTSGLKTIKFCPCV